jgi:aspartate aminotransferase-like enzyme
VLLRIGSVAVNERAWKSIDRKEKGEHGWYADLRVWRQYATEWGDGTHPRSPWQPTMSTHYWCR